MPLYYWQGDAKPGDITGDGIDGFSVATAAARRYRAASLGGRAGAEHLRRLPVLTPTVQLGSGCGPSLLAASTMIRRLPSGCRW